MEETNPTTEVSASKDVSAEIKACMHDCNCGGNKERSLSMPVCFLVKEQAKSQVAIQDLQRRLDHVETVQDDVIDAIIEFRNYLSDTKSFNSANHLTTQSSLNTTRSPATIFSKHTPELKLSEYNVPSALESTVEVRPSILKTRNYSFKDCGDLVFDELGRLSTIATSQEHSQKNIELIKSKDSAVLESDKQDSGLDSDCREHNDIHPSINKNLSNILNPESNDELLQLLDEISYRSAILQKQLGVAEEGFPIDESKAMSSACKSENETQGNHNNKCLESTKFGPTNNRFAQVHSIVNAISVGKQGLHAEHKVPAEALENSNGMVEFEAKPVSSRVSIKTRGTHNIDSTTVSAILKESNAVDLQRQALIYLVDNAVLHTKLKEAEQKLSSRQLENEKFENSLKEEARLLMLENRELRISLEEQKMESSTMKSRLVMLEKVLQSVTHENQELNWQLGESLNLQTLSKRGLHNYSPSFNCDNPVGVMKSQRRSSMPSHLSGQNDASVNCVKSKLLSNNSSYLDITMEEAGDSRPPCIVTTNASFKCRNGPIYSSTPMLSFQKQKNLKVGNVPITNDGSPANFHSVKKCFKPNYSTDRNDASTKMQRSYLEENHCKNIPDTCTKTVNFPHSTAEETSPLENAKFPFNSILEKLKSNSEYRLSKSASAKSSLMLDGSSNKAKAAPLQENEGFSHSKDKSFQGNNSDIVLQRKKGRNIQQRIQNILDRIVAESEEAS